MNEITFKSLFFKYVVRGTLGHVAVYILGVMCAWWVNWEFPWAAFDITNPCLRLVLLVVSGFIILISAIAAKEGKDDHESSVRWNSYTKEQRAEYLKYVNEYLKRKTRWSSKTRSKSPSILDNGLGVASGVVLGEIVNDLIDGD